jgi:hypothetical protein
MAQKFANSRWVKEGYLDNRSPGVVVGTMIFAGLGPVDFCLEGDFRGEIAGQAIRFRNPKFLDDSRALDVLFEFQIPQVGKVSLISFDPHPLLAPHPYFEWFSLDEQHYRLELDPSDAWIMTEEESAEIDADSLRLRRELGPKVGYAS